MRYYRRLVWLPIVVWLCLSTSRAARGDLTLKILAQFNGSNGTYPSPVTLDAQGNIYGTTIEGGPENQGTVFEIAAGTGAFSTIASFYGSNVGGNPASGMILDSQGNLYGTTTTGPGNQYGAVYEIAAGTNTLSPIATFNYTGANGLIPSGPLTSDSQGNLYGTTQTNPGSTVFEVSGGKLSTLATLGGAYGVESATGVTLDSQGNIYGTTDAGGANGQGTVFKIAAGTGALSVIANFSEASTAFYTNSGLVIDSHGNLFGETSFGGTYGKGSVYEIAAGTTTLVTLFSFNGANGNGPTGGLTLDSLGNLYGTTGSGGTYNNGTIFEIAAGTGAFTSLFSFDGSNGGYPVGSLVLTPDGNLIGSSTFPGNGNVFELVINPAVVPEPASILALGQAVLFGIALAVRSRRATVG